MPSSDPERALAARLVKDRVHAERVAALARERDFPVIEVDGSRSPDAVYREVEILFDDPLSTNEPTDLASVRRWQNENVLRNVRAWIAADEHPGVAGLAVPLSCECGRNGCSAQVSVTLQDVGDPRRPVLASGHR